MSTEKTKIARWYIVSDKADGASCLVEANNQAQAFRRAGEFYCTARPASVNEAIAMMRSAADVISAPAHPEQLDLEEQAAEPTAAGVLAEIVADDAGHATDNEPINARLLERARSVVTGGTSPPVKGGETTEAPGTRGASAPLSEYQRVSKTLARDVFGAGFTKTADDE
jgi:hypothetical protein